MNIDGRNVNENVRMKLLREEEHALSHWMEYPSNALISARLSMVAGEKSKEASSTSTASNDGAVQGSGQVASVARQILGAIA